MSNLMTNRLELVIASVTVRQDAEGRFCLNDLHRAAGEEQRHRPKYWLENAQTDALVTELETELEKGGIPPIQSKQGLGTYVAKELVYAYAMWISPKFHLEVIRAYDALMTRPAQMNPAGLSRLQLIELAMQAEQERLALENKVVELEPKAEALERIAAGQDAMTITQAAKVLGIKRNALTAYLHANSWIYRQNGSWVAHSRFIRNGCLEYKEANYTDDTTGMACIKPYCHITPKGLARLAEECKPMAA